MALRVRKHAAPRGVLGGASPMVAIALGVLLLAGGLLGAFAYDRSTAGRILPGVTVAGVEVGEMSPSEAVPAVLDTVDALLGSELAVRAGQATWQVTPAELGAAVDIRGLVDRAVALNEGLSWPERVFRRLFDRPIAGSIAPRIEVEKDPLLRFLRGVARQVEVSPTDARVDVVAGEVVLRRPRAGWALRAGEARRLLARALRASDSQVDLPLKRLEPKVSKDELGYTIVVLLSDLKLHVYDGLKLERTYPVAAGQPGYPTPEGDWTIVNKRVNPTWVNPAPEGWGASLPPVIGPGAGNPLGTRALDLDASGIRIHGTYDSGSVGTYASHGCIRMYIEDSEELFDIVPVGTPVFVIQ